MVQCGTGQLSKVISHLTYYQWKNKTFETRLCELLSGCMLFRSVLQSTLLFKYLHMDNGPPLFTCPLPRGGKHNVRISMTVNSTLKNLSLCGLVML